MYRLTDVGICDALLRALARGVPVRLLAEPHEYRFDASRLGAEFTGPYNVDRLYAAGVQIQMRKHRGLNHQKSVSLYGQRVDDFRFVELELAVVQLSGRAQLFHEQDVVLSVVRRISSIGSGTRRRSMSRLCRCRRVFR